jgi:hypothetical protein
MRDGPRAGRLHEITRKGNNQMAKRKRAKRAKKEKGQEWKHEHVSGKAHPDNNPPLQIVAQASDEAAAKETQALDAVRQKEAAPDWSALPGGTPADPSRPAAENPKPKRAATTAKSSPATDTTLGAASSDKGAAAEKK